MNPLKVYPGSDYLLLEFDNSNELDTFVKKHCKERKQDMAYGALYLVGKGSYLNIDLLRLKLSISGEKANKLIKKLKL